MFLKNYRCVRTILKRFRSQIRFYEFPKLLKSMLLLTDWLEESRITFHEINNVQFCYLAIVEYVRWHLFEQVEVLRKELVIQADKQQKVKQQVKELSFKDNSGYEVERQLEACKKEIRGTTEFIFDIFCIVVNSWIFEIFNCLPFPFLLIVSLNYYEHL